MYHYNDFLYTWLEECNALKYKMYLDNDALLDKSVVITIKPSRNLLQVSLIWPLWRLSFQQLLFSNYTPFLIYKFSDLRHLSLDLKMSPKSNLVTHLVSPYMISY